MTTNGEGGSTPRPLDGVRVLDLTRVMSGPYCTAMLADLGAEVIKVEMPGIGDTGRLFAPHIDGESAYFNMLNRGKQSITVQLKDPAGVEVIRDLIRCSDVLVENFRPGVMSRLGLDYPSTGELRPGLIYASITGFGIEGPFAQLPAFDLVIQAMSGLMSITGEREGRANAVGESLADVCTGMFAAWGIAAALFERERTGKGPTPGRVHVGLCLFDAAYRTRTRATHGEAGPPGWEPTSGDLPGRQLPHEGRRRGPGLLFGPHLSCACDRHGAASAGRRSALPRQSRQKPA